MADEKALDQVELADEMIAGRRSSTEMPADMAPWMARTILGIDRFMAWTGKLVCWLSVPIMFAMVYEVTARYAFTAPTVWAYDISRMCYGAMFVLGSAYALSKGLHIRSDFIYRTWSIKTQGWVDLLLYIVFFFPSMLLLLWVSSDWAWVSVVRAERSMDTAWAPLIGPLKSTLPVGVLLLVIQGISEVLKSVYAATRGKWPNQ